MKTIQGNLTATTNASTVTSTGSSPSLLEALSDLYGEELLKPKENSSKQEGEKLYTLRYRPSLADLEGSILPVEKVWVTSAPGVALAYAETLLKNSGIDATIEWQGTDPDEGIMGNAYENASELSLSKGIFSIFPCSRANRRRTPP